MFKWNNEEFVSFLYGFAESLQEIVRQHGGEVAWNALWNDDDRGYIIGGTFTLVFASEIRHLVVLDFIGPYTLELSKSANILGEYSVLPIVGLAGAIRSIAA